MEPIASVLVTAGTLYLTLGLLFAVPFVVRGVERIDPAARGGSWGFRLLVLPGCAALWPLLLLRLLRGAPPPEERTSHRRAAATAPALSADGEGR